MALTKLFIALGIALMIAGFFSYAVSMDSDERASMMQAFEDNPENSTINTAKFWIGYDLNTPSFHLPQWYGSDEERTFLLEELPYPDSKIAFVLVPILFAIAFILKHTLWKAPVSGIGDWLTRATISLIIMLLAIIIVYILFHLITYNWMKEASQEFGTWEAVQEGREAYSSTLQEKQGATFWIILLTAFSFISYATIIMPKSKQG